MNPWLYSHQKALSNQFSHDRLPHAILISGVSGSGKLDLAQWLMSLLHCQQPLHANATEQDDILKACGHCKSCLLLKSKTYPDYLNLIAEKNSLGVDDIRHANSFLQKTAHLGKFKTVLIENAQTMTLQAANALLKTLEEPSNNSVIILLTNDIEMLLPTILSRCRILNVRPSVGQALLQNMSEVELSADVNQAIDNQFVNLTQLPELTDQSINKAFKDFKACYESYLYGQNVESQLIQQLLANEHGLRWIEQITVNLLRKQFIIAKEPSSELSAELLNNVYKVIIKGCKIIKSYTQANKQFVCEQLIIAISDVIEQTKIDGQES
jgi:DNA polymerase-3 subunit delta'